jgi:tetratricopeptide (TPR) repeat protein
MSPERREGKTSGDAVSSDIYSLGVLATELLENKFQPTDPITTVLRTMTDPDPAKRYTTIRDATNALREALNTKARRFPMLAMHRHWYTPSKLLTKIGAAIGLLILVGSVATGYRIKDNKGVDALRIKSPNAMTSALNTTPLNGDEDESTKQAIFKARIELISEHAKVGYHEEASRMIELTEKEYGNFNSFPPDLILRYKLSKAYALGSAGKYQQAKEVYFQAKDLITLSDDLNSNTANTWRTLAHGLQGCGEHDTARNMYQQLTGHPSFNTIAWKVQADTLGCSAGLYWLDQDLPKAEVMFRQIIDSAPAQLSQREAIALAKKQSSLGVVLTSMGRYQEADQHLNAAIDRAKLYQKPSDPTICRIYTNLALNQLFQGKYDSSISIMLYVRGVWNAMPNGWRYNLAEADFILGSAYLETGKNQRALEHLSNAADLCNDLQGPRVDRLLPRINNALGDALCVSGSTSQGQALLSVSEPNLISEYGSQSPWTLKAKERALTHLGTNEPTSSSG